MWRVTFGILTLHHPFDRSREGAWQARACNVSILKTENLLHKLGKLYPSLSLGVRTIAPDAGILHTCLNSRISYRFFILWYSHVETLSTSALVRHAKELSLETLRVVSLIWSSQTNAARPRRPFVVRVAWICGRLPHFALFLMSNREHALSIGCFCVLEL